MLRQYTLAADASLTRVTTDARGSTEPSDAPTPRRFSPVRSSTTRIVPVLYAGEDLVCALGETVFHDLDDDAAVPQEVLSADLLTLRGATLVVHRELILADLRDAALAGYGTTRAAVTATAPAGYPVTREWAQLAWDAGGFDGLVWNSRRRVERLSYLLFLPTGGARGVRRRRDLDAAGPPLPLFDGPGLGAVMTAASDRNVTLVIP